MKMAVVGAGAIGGYLGTRLSLAGEDVTFIARNRNLQAINTNGFRLLLESGQEEHAGAVRAVQHCADAGPQDAVLLTVKAHQVRDLLPELRGLFGPQTVVVTMINGIPWWYFHKLIGPHEGRGLASVDPGGLIAANIEPERVIGSVVYPAAELVAPGVVKLIEGNRFTLGEPDGERSPRIEALSQAFMRAGFKAPVSRDIRSEIWVKLWGNLSFNPISALTHATLADICRFPATRALAAAMMTEAQAVAEALGVRFKITLEQRIAGAEAVGEHKTSMLQDVEHGRALELDALVGAVIELGRISGTPTPTIEAIHAVTALLGQTLAHERGRLQVRPRCWARRWRTSAAGC
ncbi:MAG: 2-dehydropantoate 2-reductase, partial [Chitinophagaceae bacterium]|nr:2-dehydropantoate 2-reductase [Rubrivivax sp.]